MPRALLPLVLLLFGFLPAPGSARGQGLKLELPAHVLRDVPFDATLRAVSPTGEDEDAFSGVVELEGATTAEGSSTVELSGQGPAAVRLVIGGAASGDVTVTSGERSGSASVRVLAGWLSVLPPLLAILLAIAFRQVILALLLGILCGAYLVAGNDPVAAFQQTISKYVVDSMADSGNASIIVFSLLLGGMVGVISRCGGTDGIVDLLTRFARTRRSAQVATAGLGSAIFFDDYANCLIVGNTMRPLTDRLRVSREKLAYIVDSTAAPVASLVPLSTWVGTQVGLVKEALPEGYPTAAYPMVLQSIPYMFYPLFALLLVFLTCATGREAFAMWSAERRAVRDGRLVRDGARPLAAGEDEASIQALEHAPRRAWNAFLPILTVVVVTLLGLWATGRGADSPDLPLVERIRAIIEASDSYQALLWASFAGLLLAVVLAVAQRILSLDQSMEAAMAGMKSMLLAMVILVLSWSLGDVTGALHADRFLSHQLGDTVAAAWVPVLVFVLAGFTAFATGSSWGTMGILVPLVVPLAYGLAVREGLDPEATHVILLGSIASVLGGSVFGDHCSPISDTTVLSSMSASCDHIDHVRTQMPYALLAAVFAGLAGYLPDALGLSIWMTLPLGALALVLVVRFFMREVEGDEARAAPVR